MTEQENMVMSGTNYTDVECSPCHKISNIISVVLWGVQDVFNIIGNVLIVILIYKDNRMKSAISKLFVNQTLADGCVGVLNLVILSYDHVAGTDNSRVVQVVFTAFRVSAIALYSESLQTLGAISFSLYMAICHPLKFKVYNQIYTVGVFIVVTWIINAVVACLVFAVDTTVVNNDFMLFSIYRFQPNNIWYEVIKMVAMFFPPLLTIVCFVRICIYKHEIRHRQIETQSDTNRLVRQSLGVLFLHSVYTLALILQVIHNNIFPVTRESEKTSRTFIIAAIVYQYLVLKLPVFLAAFKPYRRLAALMFCHCVPEVRILTSRGRSSRRRQSGMLSRRRGRLSMTQTSVPS